MVLEVQGKGASFDGGFANRVLKCSVGFMWWERERVHMSVFSFPYTATNVLIGLYPMSLPNPAHIAEAKHQHLDAFLPS